MLGKLIKYEWKATYKVGLILMGAMVLATLVGFLSLQTPLWRSLSTNTRYNDNFMLLDIMSIFAIFFYFMMLIGIFYAALIYLVVRFYRSMYTDEGYLLHTLPVTKHQILISKILVGSIWIYVVYAFMFISGGVFAASLIGAIAPGSLWGYLAEAYRDMGGFAYALQRELGISMVSWLLSVIATFVLGIPASVITFYGAVSMGQLFSKHRVLMAIASYLAITIVSFILNAILQAIAMMFTASAGLRGLNIYMSGNNGLNLAVSIPIAVGCYFVSYYVTSKKLNMD